MRYESSKIAELLPTGELNAALQHVVDVLHHDALHVLQLCTHVSQVVPRARVHVRLLGPLYLSVCSTKHNQLLLRHGNAPNHESYCYDQIATFNKHDSNRQICILILVTTMICPCVCESMLCPNLETL